VQPGTAIAVGAVCQGRDPIFQVSRFSRDRRVVTSRLASAASGGRHRSKLAEAHVAPPRHDAALPPRWMILSRAAMWR
jgi:hypothetical protein